MAISALIITYNEEHNIANVLKNLDFVDEIIVIDSFSTDQTLAIASSFNKVKVIQHHFENFSSQRNFAISKAKNDWILFLDADERLTQELKNEVLHIINSKSTTGVAFLFYRVFMFKNSVLRFSGWQNDKIFRLFHKNFVSYTTERLVHEKLTVNGEIGTLKNKLIHYSYTDFDSYKAKMINYGKFKAKEKFSKGLKPFFLLSILHPIYNFLYSFIVRLGFLDGQKGIIICYLNAYSVFVRYKELKKLNSQD